MIAEHPSPLWGDNEFTKTLVHRFCGRGLRPPPLHPWTRRSFPNPAPAGQRSRLIESRFVPVPECSHRTSAGAAFDVENYHRQAQPDRHDDAGPREWESDFLRIQAGYGDSSRRASEFCRRRPVGIDVAPGSRAEWGISLRFNSVRHNLINGTSLTSGSNHEHRLE